MRIKEVRHCIRLYTKVIEDEAQEKILRLVSKREPHVDKPIKITEENLIKMKRSTIVALIQCIAAAIRKQRST